MGNTSAKKYAQALQHAAVVIDVIGEDVQWINDTSEGGTAKFTIKWNRESQAEAEALRDRMVALFHPTRLVTVQRSTWGSIAMDLPNHPDVEVEIGFYERPKE